MVLSLLDGWTQQISLFHRSENLVQVHRTPQSPEFSGRTLQTFFSVLTPLSGRELWPSYLFHHIIWFRVLFYSNCSSDGTEYILMLLSFPNPRPWKKMIWFLNRFNLVHDPNIYWYLNWQRFNNNELGLSATIWGRTVFQWCQQSRENSI